MKKRMAQRIESRANEFDSQALKPNLERVNFLLTGFHNCCSFLIHFLPSILPFLSYNAHMSFHYYLFWHFEIDYLSR